MVSIKNIDKIWPVFNLLQCLFGLFRSAFNTYISKSFFGPSITLATIIFSGFFGVFMRTIFLVLQSDSTQYKTPSHKKRRKHAVDSCTPHSQHELNLLHKKFENFLKKFSSPIHNNSNKRHTPTLPVSVYQCYETPIDSDMKPDFQSLQFQTFQCNKLEPSRGISLSRDSIEKDSDYQEKPEELLFYLLSTQIYSFLF